MGPKPLWIGQRRKSDFEKDCRESSNPSISGTRFGRWGRLLRREKTSVGGFFTNCFISDIDALVLYGGIHEVYLGFHRSLSKRFPFAIYYKTAEDTVYVYAVLDCRRDTAVIEAVLTRLGGL